MKKVSKLAAALAAAALFVLTPETNVLPAHAEESVTYAVKYVSDEEGWRCQFNTNAYDDAKGGYTVSYLRECLKAGDTVVVYNPAGTYATLDLGDVRLGELTLSANNGLTIIKTGGIDNCHVLGGNTCAINGTVTNAHVYDVCNATFNNNVDNLTIWAKNALDGGALSNVSCAGTVGHFIATTSEQTPSVFYDLYDFKENAFRFSEKRLQTAATDYATQPAAPQAPAAPAAPSSDADEYDSVPKTGDSALYLWLFGLSAVLLAGSLALRKSGN